MKASSCPIPGLLRIELTVHRDERGFFFESFRQDQMEAFGIGYRFIQDNHSRSEPGVLRGLHFQEPAQGKLVSVAHGRIWDVAVDLRRDSETFGQHFGLELDEGTAFWIPPGFAHGFCVLGREPADLIYKVTSYFNGPGESGVRWDDPDLNIAWPLSSPMLSPRDASLKSFRELFPA
jgi:dTDP-4-dehydrorhamnose 3,5-epimerase